MDATPITSNPPSAPAAFHAASGSLRDVPSVVSFSGGQTSGFMLRRLMDQHPDFNDRFAVIFENTGKEHDTTLDFVHEVETKWGVPVVWLEYVRIPAIEIDPQSVPDGRKRSNLIKQQERGEKAHWWRVVSYETAARRFDKWTPFDELLEWANVLPNVRTRMCSVQLKVRTRDRYLRALGVEAFNAFIGIRSDEAHRVTEILANTDRYERPQFPLVEDRVTKEQVDAFWDTNDFRLNIPNHMGNCDLCFLKAKWKRLAAARSNPEGAQWWADWEARREKERATGNGARFIAGQSYAALIAEAGHPELALDFTEQDIACSCAVGGYRHRGDEEENIKAEG